MVGTLGSPVRSLDGDLGILYYPDSVKMEKLVNKKLGEYVAKPLAH